MQGAVEMHAFKIQLDGSEHPKITFDSEESTYNAICQLLANCMSANNFRSFQPAGISRLTFHFCMDCNKELLKWFRESMWMLVAPPSRMCTIEWYTVGVGHWALESG